MDHELGEPIVEAYDAQKSQTEGNYSILAALDPLVRSL